MDGELARSIHPATTRYLVLVLSEDEAVHKELDALLTDEGFACRSVRGLAGVERTDRSEAPALIIVEGRINGEDTAAVCRRLRSETDSLILAMGHSEDVIDRVLALELGADDYLAQPAAPRELVARVRALVRRRRWPTAALPTGRSGPEWRLDLATRRIRGPKGAATVTLTPGEYALLTAFLKQPGLPIRAVELVGDDDRDLLSMGTLRVMVHRLRRKLESTGFTPAAIRAVQNRGGYVLDAAVAASARLT